MVYRRSMTPVLALLLLLADPAAAQADEQPAASPAQATAEPAPAPATAAPGQLPEATAPQAPAKQAPPKQQLRILAQDPRMEAYTEFRSLYETARFEEALPLAKRVVELSENDAEREFELPIAYNNLGATQYQLGDYTGSERSYQKSLELLESTQGISSRRLIVPLAGLGAVYAARDEHAIAAQLFDRALAVSRRADGLFNLNQLPLLEQAADSRYAMTDFGGAEREHLYAVKIAEQNFGYGDPRTVASLLELASFYEGLKEYIAARNMYLRARDVAMQTPGYSADAVRSLVGIARTHRLQYTMDPDSLESQQPARDEVTGEMVGKVYKESRVPPPAADRTGLKSVQTALELLRSTPNPPSSLMTETLIELGDWYQATSRPAIAAPFYAEAADIYEKITEADPLAGNPLKAPRMVFYRPPLSATRGLNTLSGQYVIRKAVFSFAVTESGEPVDIAVVSSDMEEGQLSQARRSMSKAIYSPRFSEGKPVSTAGVTFTSEWYQEYQPDAEQPSTAKPVSTTPAAKPAPETKPEPASTNDN
jgi:tetratricopeptide (TPR) repeat protein